MQKILSQYLSSCFGAPLANGLLITHISLGSTKMTLFLLPYIIKRLQYGNAPTATRLCTILIEFSPGDRGLPMQKSRQETLHQTTHLHYPENTSSNGVPEVTTELR